MIVANQLERHAIEGDPVLVGRGDQPAQLHPSKVRGKNAPQYLDKGTLLSKKYRLEKMIGGGGFGQIYRATDIDMGTVVAAKVEPQSEDAGRMVLEQMVLTKLVGTRHSPRLVGPSMIICLVGPMRTRCKTPYFFVPEKIPARAARSRRVFFKAAERPPPSTTIVHSQRKEHVAASRLQTCMPQLRHGCLTFIIQTHARQTHASSINCPVTSYCWISRSADSYSTPLDH
ncbi:hypothetical protein Y032_0234g3135 [Ancylostoma ceylanicum]|uniref:Protein kinase domain-containing protein n=1 Tax=Ancylostoma ceylanicum TaxID=53326 RepID=A0A016SFQ3_9BILA|nr:hypothetical protein Y032_0234g3135 [Ancylostoma ceylanicum]